MLTFQIFSLVFAFQKCVGLSYFVVKFQVSDEYITTGLIIILYIFICISL